jgi:hypothetical protein
MPKRSPKTKQALATVDPIEPVIQVIRGQRVILDSDLAGEDLWRHDEAAQRAGKAKLIQISEGLHVSADGR